MTDPIAEADEASFAPEPSDIETPIPPIAPAPAAPQAAPPPQPQTDRRERPIAEPVEDRSRPLQDRLAALDARLDVLTRTDWRAMFETSPVQAFERQAEQQQLNAERGRLAVDVLREDLARTAEAERNRQRRWAESQAILARDIPGWSGELAGRVSKFASSELGVTPEEMGRVTDPRLIKALWMAYSATADGKGNEERALGAPEPRPATALGGRAPAFAGPDDRMSMDEWTRRRRAQLGRSGERR